VKLGKNAVLSEAFMGGGMKKSSVFEWHKEHLHVEITNEDMLIILFDIRDIVHFEFIPQGQTVNQAYCVEIFKLLH
jgi:hypothetical protein